MTNLHCISVTNVAHLLDRRWHSDLKYSWPRFEECAQSWPPIKQQRVTANEIAKARKCKRGGQGSGKKEPKKAHQTAAHFTRSVSATFSHVMCVRMNFSSVTTDGVGDDLLIHVDCDKLWKVHTDTAENKKLSTSRRPSGLQCAFDLREFRPG